MQADPAGDPVGLPAAQFKQLQLLQASEQYQVQARVASSCCAHRQAVWEFSSWRMDQQQVQQQSVSRRCRSSEEQTVAAGNVGLGGPGVCGTACWLSTAVGVCGSFPGAC